MPISNESKDNLNRDLQKIFEFIVKNRGDALSHGWTNAQVKNFIRWALYYRKLFIVWAPAGAGQRIAALGVAWRTESVGPQSDPLTFENTEFGDNLYVYQVIVHRDFAHTGALFQLLSLALWRYPGVERVFWLPDSGSTQKIVQISTQKLLKVLARSARPQRVAKYAERNLPCQKVAVDPRSPMLRPVL